MSLPYAAATSGDRAIGEIEKFLKKFGCTSFGSIMHYGDGVRVVQFDYRQHTVVVKASAKGYAAAWLRENPHTNRSKLSKAAHEKKALDIGTVAVCSVLRDWIKGQIMAIETGILSFEGAFLGSILLSNGKTVLEETGERGLLKLKGSQIENP